MNIKFIKSHMFNSSSWSGGTTTQLTIFPEDSVYKEGNFIFRMSSAKVEVEESIFTRLDNYKRIIMILDGQVRLVHKDHHSLVLKQFEKDYFCGAWQTSSYGRVVDYNLMMSKNCHGDIEYIKVNNKGMQIDFSKKINELEDKERVKVKRHTQAFYCYSGLLKIKIGNETYILEKGDFLQVDFSSNENSRNLEISLINSDVASSALSSYSEIISTFVSY